MEVPRYDDYKKYVLQFVVFASLLAWFILEYITMSVHLLVISMLWVLIFLKVEERARAFWYASEAGVANITNVFADYMMYEHTLGESDEVNPITLKGYKYLVDMRNVGYNMKPPSYHVSIDIKSAVTIDKIWEYQDQDQGEVLNSRGDPKGKLKDLCLSMSLFWLLLRRFGGYSLYESKLAREKTWRFVQEGLLEDDVRSPERVFRVIEIELKFLYDFLYTKYFAGYIGSWQLIKRLCQLAIIVTISTFYIWLTQFFYESSVNESDIVTSVALTMFTVNEIVQTIILFNCECYKVKWICWYVRERTSRRIWGKIIRFLCLVPNKRWTKRLGQYSLLHHHNYNPCIFRVFRHCLGNLVEIPRVGQKESSNVKLSQEVKKGFVLSLRKYDLDMQINGISVWKRSGVSDVDLDLIHKYCKLETQTHVILVWHIATTFCEMSYDAKKQEVPINAKNDLKVAKELSMYCSYLVAFAPKLLPVPEITTSSIFDQVIKEANKLFERKLCECWFFRCLCKDNNKYKKMSEISEDEGELKSTNIRRGALLGKHLKAIFNNNDLRLWKNLAEFWGELLLFLAPSNDHMIHAEHLAKGGEQVTHLWALLTHAGIVEPRQFVSDQTSSLAPAHDV